MTLNKSVQPTVIPLRGLPAAELRHWAKKDTMSQKLSDLEKFARWYATPLKVLKGIPDGDGAFVALSIGCFLCERYYRSVAGTQDKWRDRTVLERATQDLDVSKDFFEDFWDIFRHGTQHQGTPKKKKKVDKTTGVKSHFRWRISHTFAAVPTRYRKKNRVIPKLVRNEQVTISYLYFPPLLWSQINSYTKSDEGFAKTLNAIPTPQPAKWLIVVIWSVVFVGVVSLLYLAAVGIIAVLK